MAKVTTLAEMWWPLMQAPTIRRSRCAICGATYPLNQHHLVKRSAGKLYRNGAEVPKPTITLCGSGNASGCHGKAHAGLLHFRWVGSDIPAPDMYLTTFRGGHLEYLLVDEPCDYLTALKMDGWKRVMP